MKAYRRWFVSGGTYFFTLVTQGRRPLLCNEVARTILGDVFRECRSQRPFETVATVLLPDHFHAVWSLPPGDDDYSTRWAWIKKEFTKRWLAAGGCEAPIGEHRKRRRRRGVWQPRFWEHAIRDETDLERHVDYVHYNPVKHGLVAAPADWPWSTFHRFVAIGTYDAGWGRSVTDELRFEDIRNSTGE
ncbi:MAG: transposase [Pirellulales bacterium]